jgi:hypothetical protein
MVLKREEDALHGPDLLSDEVEVMAGTLFEVAVSSPKVHGSWDT